MSALVPWRGIRELDTLSRRMDDMFERLTKEFFGSGGWERPRAEAAMWEPAIEWYQ